MADENIAPKLRSLEYSIDSIQRNLDKRVDGVASRVDGLADSVRETAILQNDIRLEVRALRNELNSYMAEERLARNMQFAQTALIDVRAQLDRQFGHHKAVRRGTIGMLQAMDAGIVTHSTLQQAAEQLMIDAPHYWLAPAQVALAAWIRNSRALAERALLEATNRDSSKTALFFSLVLARYERRDATAQWIQEYVRRLDSTALNREFNVVLDAVAQGALGGRARDLVKTICISWYDRLSQSQEMVDKQVENWRGFIEEQGTELAGEFNILPTVCPNWSENLQWLEAATVFGRTEQWLRERFAVITIPSEDLRATIDDILRNLVTAYDENEVPLLQAAARWQAVIKHGGDHAKALPKSTATPRGQLKTDFLTLLTNTGINEPSAASSVMTSQFALTIAADWIELATKQLSALSRGGCPASLRVSIGEWQRDVGPSEDARKLVQEFSGFVDREVAREVARVTLRRPWEVLVGLTIMTLASGLIPYFKLIKWPYSVIPPAVLLISSVVAAIAVFRAYRTMPRRKDNVRLRGQQRKNSGVATIFTTFAEVRKFYARWEVEIGNVDRLIEFIQGESARSASMSVLSIEESLVPGGVDDWPEPIVGAGDAGAGAEGGGGAWGSESEPEQFALRLPDWDLLPPASYRRSSFA